MTLFSLRFCDFSTLSLFSVNFFPNIQHSRCFRLLKSLPRDVLLSFARHSRTIRLFSAPFFAAGPGDSWNSYALPDFQCWTYRFAMWLWQSPFWFAQHSRSFCSSIFTFVTTLVVSACPFFQLFNTLVHFRTQFYRIFKNIWFFNIFDPSVYPPPLSRAEISNL